MTPLSRPLALIGVALLLSPLPSQAQSDKRPNAKLSPAGAATSRAIAGARTIDQVSSLIRKSGLAPDELAAVLNTEAIRHRLSAMAPPSAGSVEIATSRTAANQVVEARRRRVSDAHRKALVEINQRAAADRSRAIATTAVPRSTPSAGVPRSLETAPVPSNARVLIDASSRRPSDSELPWITGTTPAQVNPGDDLTIQGLNFGSARGSLAIQLGDVNVVCPIERWTNNQVVVRVPAGLDAMLGGVSRTARVWLQGERHRATTEIRLGEDAGPTIEWVSSADVRPGQLLTISGAGFTDRRGRVELYLDDARRSFDARVGHWESTMIQATVPSDIVGVGFQSAQLVVHGGSAGSARRPVEFLPTLATETFEAAHDEGGRSGEIIHVDHDFDVRNGWRVRDAFTVVTQQSPDAGIEWLVRPGSGDADGSHENALCVTSWSYRGSGMRQAGVRGRVVVIIEGPVGLDYR